MNVVVVLIDSLNRHYLSCYGDSRVDTPALDRFARRALRFDNHFVGSLPCIPARREIFAGRKEMLWRPWGPMEPYDVNLAQRLHDKGFRTTVVTDHYHYWELAGNGYVQPFRASRFIRGHEYDYWRTAPGPDDPVPEWVRSIEHWRPGNPVRQYYGNVAAFAGEQDYFPAKVMTSAVDWLETERPAGEPFYLHVESFDVHEPFHVPEPYRSRYWPHPHGDEYTVWPPYQERDALERFMAATTADELAFIRSQYEGKLAMLDHWFGTLLDALDRQGLWDDTAVIVTTDHGHDLGERGTFAKQYPHYDSHAHIPLLVWHPEHPGNGAGISALTATVDLHATILGLFGIGSDHAPHSRDLGPLIEGSSDSVRDAHLYGSFGQGACLTDGEWTVFASPVSEREPLYHYTPSIYHSLNLQTANPPVDQGLFIRDVSLPQWKIPVDIRPWSLRNFLFHRASDPGQQRNLWDSEPTHRERMLDKVRAAFESEGAPPEQYTRLGLR